MRGAHFQSRQYCITKFSMLCNSHVVPASRESPWWYVPPGTLSTEAVAGTSQSSQANSICYGCVHAPRHEFSISSCSMRSSKSGKKESSPNKTHSRALAAFSSTELILLTALYHKLPLG